MKQIRETNVNNSDIQIRNGREQRLTKVNPSLYGTFHYLNPKISLKPKAIIFSEEWIFDFNGSRAASCAGYSMKNIAVTASRLLTNVKVLDYIEWLQANLAQTTGISPEKVLKERAKIAFSSIGNLYDGWMTLRDFHDLSEDDLAAIKSIKSAYKRVDEEFIEIVEITMHDKEVHLRGIERTLGYDKPIQIEVTTKDDRVKALTDEALDAQILRLAKEKHIKNQSE